ncbi:MAG: dehydratase [Firmicutes bacterium]|nr:dehydratase [Bacillota bacterium]
MYFEEFSLGQVFTVGPISLSAEEIQEFAAKYDPLPIHTDPAFAADSFFEGLIASGFHTLVAIWGEWTRQNRLGAEVIGGLGLDYLQWKAPVRPGDELRAEIVVSELRPSSKPGRGIVGMKTTVTNQRGETVLVTQVKALMKAKGGA